MAENKQDYISALRHSFRMPIFDIIQKYIQDVKRRECPKEWAKASSATEITEFSEKNSEASVNSPGTVCQGRCVAKPTELDTPKKDRFIIHFQFAFFGVTK